MNQGMNSNSMSTFSSLSINDNDNDNDEATMHQKEKWPPFNPFVRHETSRFGIFIMIITGPVLVPIRLAGTLMTLFLGWIWANIALIGLDKDPSCHPYSRFKQRIFFGGFRILARVLLFFYGYIWINVRRSTSNNNNNKNNDDNESSSSTTTLPTVVVCNHTGFVELLYLAYAYGASFVSREENKNLPFMGKISIAMQCIFVERGTGKRNNTFQKIKERVEAPPGQWPMLAIAPEGTTTNGSALIHFHTGAFRPGQRVLAVATKMPFSPIWGYDPSFSCCNMNLHIIGLMSQPWNRLTVYELPVYVPTDTERENPSLFAKNVRDAIAQTLNLPTYELQWSDKLIFEHHPHKQELGRKLLMEKNGGVLPPEPVFTHDVFGNALPKKKNSNSTSKDKDE